MMSLCAECREEWLSWLDYRPARQVALLVVGGSPEEARRSRLEDWRRVVKSQQALVEDHCRD